ncbi:MAG: hypothetical protein N3G74_00725 [Candidatus Micrarchaeota archaeon]|nr:hypothetical protein [Candidatus Micrarchaeota archaeon]
MKARTIILALAFTLQLLAFISAQVKTQTLLLELNYLKLDNDNYNFSAKLVSIYIPESSQTLKDQIETGKADPSQLVSKFDYSPLPSQEIKVYSISSYDENVRELLCIMKTDENGVGSCVARATAATDREIRFVYEGDETHVRTQGSFAITGSFSSPPLKDLIDASWIILFIIIGVSIAALYASGRDPTSILDITTPKIKGVKSPKAQKLKFEGKGKAILAASSALAGTTAFLGRMYWKGNLNISVLKTLNTTEKYLSPQERREIKSLYNTTSVFATAKIAEKAAAVRPKLIKMINSTNRKLLSKQKAKAKLQELKNRLKTEGEQWRLQEMEKKIDRDIERYTREIQTYEKDLRAMSSEALISSIGLNDIIIDRFKETKDTIDSKILSSLIQYINDPRNAKLNIKEIKEYSIFSTDAMGIKDIEAENRVHSVFLAKIELERLYIAEAIKVLNIVSNKFDSLSGEEKAKYYKILNLLEPEKERLNHIKEIYKNKEIIKESIKDLGIDYYLNELKNKLNSLSAESEEYKKLSSLIEQLKNKSDEEKIKELADVHHQTGVKLHDSFLSEIAKARESLNNSINNFYSEYEKYHKKETTDIEQTALKTIIEFGVMSKKAADYFADINSGRVPYSHDYPKLDQESAKKIFDIIAIKYDPEINFEILYNAYISPFMKEHTVEFAKERIRYFEDEEVGRTVFEKLFNDIWYLRIDPKEEYYNLDMKLIGYYGVEKALQKMETEKIILRGEPDWEGKKAALDYAEYFIRTYSPDKLGYDEKKQIGYEEKKLIGYEQKKQIGYESKKLIEYKGKKKENSKDDKDKE